MREQLPDLQKAYDNYRQQSDEEKAITTSKLREMINTYTEEKKKIEGKLANDDNYTNNRSVGMEFLRQSKDKFERKLANAKERLNDALEEAESLQGYLDKTERDLSVSNDLENIYAATENNLKQKVESIGRDISPIQQKLMNGLLEDTQNSLVNIRETKYFLEIEKKSTLSDIAANKKSIDYTNTEIDKIKTDLNSVENKIVDDRLDKNERINDEKQLQKLTSVIEYLKLREAFTSVDSFEEIADLMNSKQDKVDIRPISAIEPMRPTVSTSTDVRPTTSAPATTPDIEALISALQQEDTTSDSNGASKKTEANGKLDFRPNPNNKPNFTPNNRPQNFNNNQNHGSNNTNGANNNQNR